MSASQKSLRVAFVAAVPLLLALALVAAVALPTLAANGTTVTKTRTNGRGANVQLFDPASNSYGFITVSQDQQANTSSIIFNLGTLDGQPRHPLRHPGQAVDARGDGQDQLDRMINLPGPTPLPLPHS